MPWQDGIRKRVRGHLEANRVDRERRDAEAQAVAGVWDRDQLRHGTLLGKALDDSVSRHPQCWHQAGVVKAAFDSIGVHLSEAMRDTHREIEVVGVCHAAAKRVQRDLLGRFASASTLPDWFIVQRAFDGTPVEVAFGGLSTVLGPMAKYKWRKIEVSPGVC